MDRGRRPRALRTRKGRRPTARPSPGSRRSSRARARLVPRTGLGAAGRSGEALRIARCPSKGTWHNARAAARGGGVVKLDTGLRATADGVACRSTPTPRIASGVRSPPHVASSISAKRQRQILVVLLGAFSVLGRQHRDLSRSRTRRSAVVGRQCLRPAGRCSRTARLVLRTGRRVQSAASRRALGLEPPARPEAAAAARHERARLAARVPEICTLFGLGGSTACAGPAASASPRRSRCSPRSAWSGRGGRDRGAVRDRARREQMGFHWIGKYRARPRAEPRAWRGGRRPERGTVAGVARRSRARGRQAEGERKRRRRRSRRRPPPRAACCRGRRGRGRQSGGRALGRARPRRSNPRSRSPTRGTTTRTDRSPWRPPPPPVIKKNVATARSRSSLSARPGPRRSRCRRSACSSCRSSPRTSSAADLTHPGDAARPNSPTSASRAASPRSTKDRSSPCSSSSRRASKVNSIVALEDDLALALRAIRIRVRSRAGRARHGRRRNQPAPPDGVSPRVLSSQAYRSSNAALKVPRRGSSAARRSCPT